MDFSRFPNFVIIGTQKAGTTSIYHSLNRHPEIFMCSPKEPGFFLLDERKGYENIPQETENKILKIGDLKAYQDLYQDGKDFLARGEATTLYLESEYAAKKIFEYNPSMRLITVLRNPIDRAYSGYWMNHLSREKRSFSEAIMQEMNGYLPPNSNIIDELLKPNYLNKGLYYEHLSKYLSYFRRSQIKILLFEDLKNEFEKCLQEIFMFLGVNTSIKVENDIKYNRSGIPGFGWNIFKYFPGKKILKNKLPDSLLKQGQFWKRKFLLKKYPPMSEELRNKLKKYFEQDILQLQTIIDRDLNGWLL